MRRAPILLCLLAAVAACAEHPREAVLQIDPDGRQYRTRACREARAESLRYDDMPLTRTAVGVAGNLLIPFAGTVAASAARCWALDVAGMTASIC